MNLYFVIKNLNLSNFFYQTFILIAMGRKKKYHTEEEQLHAKREKWNRWYSKNKESLNKKRIEDYYDKKRRMD